MQVELDSNHPESSVTVHVGKKAGLIYGTVRDAESGEGVNPCAELRWRTDPSIVWTGMGIVESNFRLLVPADTPITLVLWQRGYEPWFYRDDVGADVLQLRSADKLKLSVRMKPTAERDRPPTDDEIKGMMETSSRIGCSTPPPIP